MKLFASPKQEYTEVHQRLISYKSVRGLIGWTGLLLPIVLIVGGALVATLNQGSYRWDGFGVVQTSISDYHGSPMRNVFVGMLTAIGVFLLAYKGHDTRDNWMASVAGASAILVAIFPDDCDAPSPGICAMDSFAGPLQDVEIISSGMIHFTAAFVLFGLMGLMCSAQFTRTANSPRAWPRLGEISEGKFRRNMAFIISGFTIFACIAFLAIHKLVGGGGEYTLLIVETIMVVCFGFAWQLKGEVGRNVQAGWIAWLFKPYQKLFWPSEKSESANVQAHGVAA